MTALPHDVPARLPRRVTRPPARPSKRSLTESVGKVVPLRPVQQMRRGTFIVLVASLLTVSLITMLLLNTVLSQGSFRRYELLTKTGDLDTRELALGAEVSKLESPAELERRAREQGMVPNQNPAFIDLQTGRVLGEGIPAPESAVSASPTEAANGTNSGATTGGNGTTAGTATGADGAATNTGGTGAALGTPDNPLGVGSGPRQGASGAQSGGAGSQGSTPATSDGAAQPSVPEGEKPLGLQPAGTR